MIAFSTGGPLEPLENHCIKSEIMSNKLIPPFNKFDSARGAEYCNGCSVCGLTTLLDI